MHRLNALLLSILILSTLASCASDPERPEVPPPVVEPDDMIDDSSSVESILERAAVYASLGHHLSAARTYATAAELDPVEGERYLGLARDHWESIRLNMGQTPGILYLGPERQDLVVQTAGLANGQTVSVSYALVEDPQYLFEDEFPVDGGGNISIPLEPFSRTGTFAVSAWVADTDLLEILKLPRTEVAGEFLVRSRAREESTALVILETDNDGRPLPNPEVAQVMEDELQALGFQVQRYPNRSEWYTSSDSEIVSEAAEFSNLTRVLLCRFSIASFEASDPNVVLEMLGTVELFDNGDSLYRIERTLSGRGRRTSLVMNATALGLARTLSQEMETSLP